MNPVCSVNLRHSDPRALTHQAGTSEYTKYTTLNFQKPAVPQMTTWGLLQK